MFEVGDKVGSYEIVARLKSGGMATLFLGRRGGAAGFAKYVAIKVVHEHLRANEAFTQMFVDEARLGARIQHPNVVHVEEFEEEAGRLYLVMEYVYGCSLGQFFYALARRKRRLSPELAAHIALKVADGLHAAHELRDRRGERLGVVHRDVSPQNILLAYQGNVKLIDFGVAKARGRLQETQQRSIKGKFRYMSPEQARGGELDRRTDVYALGVVLWEMLTMRRRFNGKTDADVLKQVRSPEPVAPSRFYPDLPPDLDALVLKATAPDPADRYQSAHELRQALVEVVPKAAALHESVLGELLAVVMADHIEQRKSLLPSGVSGLTVDIPSGESVVADEALQTLTIATADIELLADIKSDPTGPPEPPTKLIATPGPVVAPEAPPAETLPPPAPDGVPLPAVLAVVGVMLLALGALSVLAVYFVSDPPETTATQLPVADDLAPDAPDAGARVEPPTPVATTPEPPPTVVAAPEGDGDEPAEADPPVVDDPPSDEGSDDGAGRRRRRDDGESGRGRRRGGPPIADTW